MTKKGLYIYCIADISADQFSFDTGGIENVDAEIITVNYKDISAVVSEAEIKQYKPTRRNNMTHEGVIQRVVESYNVLPFRFGIVANHKEEILNLLSEKYHDFTRILKKVDQKIEMGIKVTYLNVNEVLGQIGQTNPLIQQIKREYKDVTGNQTKIIEVGKIIEKELQEISLKYKDRIYKKLSHFAVESVINENFSTEMILNASFLIDKNKEPEFDELINQLDIEYDSKLNFQSSGPFPPYSFV